MSASRERGGREGRGRACAGAGGADHVTRGQDGGLHRCDRQGGGGIGGGLERVRVWRGWGVLRGRRS